MAPETRNATKRARFEAAAAALMANEDIVIEILMRLPQKSVLKCKCVSKRWNAMVSNPIFFANYTKKNPNRLSGFIMNGRELPNPEFFFVSLADGEGISRRHGPKFINIPESEIRSLCSGLLCYSTPHITDPEQTSFYVCNSTSGQTKLVRVLQDPMATSLLGVNLAFDPTNSAFYHLVFVYFVWRSRDNRNQFIQFAIYSSKTNSWTRQGLRGELFNVPSDTTFANGAHWNGAIYWYHKFSNSLSYLDVETCSYKMLRMPELARASAAGAHTMHIDYIGEFGGALHLIGTCRPMNTAFTVFKVKKDRSDVNVKFRGDFISVAAGLPEMVRRYPRDGYLFTVVTVFQGEGEGEEKMSMVVKTPGGLVQYNVKDKSWKRLCRLPRGCNWDRNTWDYMRVKAFQCFQTIASP